MVRNYTDSRILEDTMLGVSLDKHMNRWDLGNYPKLLDELANVKEAKPQKANNFLRRQTSKFYGGPRSKQNTLSSSFSLSKRFGNSLKRGDYIKEKHHTMMSDSEDEETHKRNEVLQNYLLD